MYSLHLSTISPNSLKTYNYMPMPEMSEQAIELMTAFGVSGYMFPLIAITEIIAGILLLNKKTTGLGAVLMMPITVNIFFFHAFLDTAGLGMGIVLLLINIVILVSEKKRLYPMCGCDATCC